jgi:hypothetical protein
MRGWTAGLIITFLLQACSNETISKGSNHKKIKSIGSLEDSAVYRLDTATLIRSIEESSCVESEYIGFGGGESAVYASFRRLDHLISDSIWLKLSYDRKPVMRAYAYWALLRRNSPLLPKIRDHLKNDRATFCYYSADVMYQDRVRDFVRYLKVDTTQSK